MTATQSNNLEGSYCGFYRSSIDLKHIEKFKSLF